MVKVIQLRFWDHGLTYKGVVLEPLVLQVVKLEPLL
jgi:hypothetical protein